MSARKHGVSSREPSAQPAFLLCAALSLFFLAKPFSLARLTALVATSASALWWAQVDFESRSAFTAYTFVEALGVSLVPATCARVARLVGSSGLEPPTSCLSGTRSNLLSYEPVFLFSLDRLHSPRDLFLLAVGFPDWWR